PLPLKSRPPLMPYARCLPFRSRPKFPLLVLPLCVLALLLACVASSSTMVSTSPDRKARVSAIRLALRPAANTPPPDGFTVSAIGSGRPPGSALGSSGGAIVAQPPRSAVSAVSAASVAAAADGRRRAAAFMALSSACGLRQHLQHVVGGGEHLGVHLVGALRRDHVDHLLDDLHVRAFQRALLELAQAV